MKTIKETKLNTISSLTNTHMTKLLPQELSIYSKKEYHAFVNKKLSHLANKKVSQLW